MSETKRVTAAPIPIVFDGKTYYMSPMRDIDYGEFEAWVQDQVIALAKRNLKGLPLEQQNAMLEHAFDRANELTIHSPDALSRMSTVEGAAKVTFLSLRKRHSEVTEEQVREWMTNPDTLSRALDKFDSVNALPKIVTKKRATQKTVRKKRKAIRRQKAKSTGH